MKLHLKFHVLAASLAALAAWPAAAQGTSPANEYGPPELIEAAKREGQMVLYTASFVEVEQEYAKHFNKRFPFVRVQIVRAPGGQLLTRIRSEAAAGKLTADMIEISDRAQAKQLEDVFADYAPPNAADYPPESITAPNKLWARSATGWVIAWNAAIAKNPPKSFMDLTKPEYGKKQIGQVIAMSGGTTWTRVMFERKVLGEDYWRKLAANDTALYPSGAPLADALIRGEVTYAALQGNIVVPKKHEGAPIDYVIPPEGLPITIYAAGITKTAAHPNAAKLFMNWSLSVEGQTVHVKELGQLSALRTAPPPEGMNAGSVKIWYPDPTEFETLREKWTEDWNVVFNYRQ